MAARNPWFEVLGVAPDAPAEQVREAYLGLVKAWHPDRFAGSPAMAARAEERLKEINAAYDLVRSWDRGERAPEERYARAAWGEPGWAEWADAGEPAGFRLLFARGSLAFRAIALLLALMIALIAVIQTVNVLDLVLRGGERSSPRRTQRTLRSHSVSSVPSAVNLAVSFARGLD